MESEKLVRQSTFSNILSWRDLKKWTIVLICVVVAVFIFVQAFFVYPVPTGDSLYFHVPALQYVQGFGLTNPIFPDETIIDRVDPTGAKRLLYYPPIFSVVISWLMFQETAKAVFIAVGLLHILVLVLSGLLFYKCVTKKEPLTWAGVLVTGIGVLALASTLGEMGRPEVLTRLWIVLAGLVPFYVTEKNQWIYFGVFLGLIFGTQPIAGAFATGVLGMYFGVTSGLRDALRRMGGALVLGAVVALGAIAIVGPFGLWEAVRGTVVNLLISYNEIAVLESQLTFRNLIGYFVTSPAMPFYGLVLLVLFSAAIYWYRNRRGLIKSPLFAILSFAVLFYLIAKSSYWLWHVSYVGEFSPLIFAIFILLFLGSKKMTKIALILVMLLVSVGFARSALLFPSFLGQKEILETARGSFAEARTLSKPDEKMGFTGSLWPLTENYEHTYTFPSAFGSGVEQNTSFVFVQQRYSGLKTPSNIPGCALIEDKFSRDTPKLFGVTLGNTMPGYGYAVYDCRQKI